MTASSSLPLLRLLQIADSSFPAGGFAYSHGLEWLEQAGLVATEDDLAALLRAYVSQAAGRQSLPAALRCLLARSVAGMVAVDRRLDASILSSAERDSSTATGRRLLQEASVTFGGHRTRQLHAAVSETRSPGHFAVAFGCVASDHGVDPRAALAALGFTIINSITQAAVRLGLIGQRAALRVATEGTDTLDATVDRVLSQRPPSSYGAFLPAVEVATTRHHTLPFRMFAS
ncbi:MAG: urease accessory protein UreF [Dehalococcoidia bacterium]